jgi:hypothetical protein
MNCPSRIILSCCFALVLFCAGCSPSRERYQIGNYEINHDRSNYESGSYQSFSYQEKEVLRIDTWTGRVDRFVDSAHGDKKGKETWQDRWVPVGLENPDPADQSNPLNKAKGKPRSN